MKKLLLGTLLCLLFLPACKKERTVISHIPEEALAVATIQTSSLAAKLLVDKVGDYDLEEALMKLKRGIKTGKEAKAAIHRILANPAEFGLDLFTEAYIHISQSESENEPYAALYLNVSDPDRLNAYMEEKFSKVIDVTLSDEGSFIMAQFNQDDLTMGWNDYLFTFLLPIGPAHLVQPKAELDRLFSLNNPQTLPEHHLHVGDQSDVDIAFSLSAEQLQHSFKDSEKFLYFTDDFRFLNAYFNFHKGHVAINLEGKVKEDAALVYQQVLKGNGFKEQFPSFDEEKVAGLLNLQFNPKVVSRLVKEFRYRVALKMALLPTSFDEDEFYDLFQGSAFMLLSEGDTRTDWQFRMKTNDQMGKLLREFKDFGLLEKEKSYFKYPSKMLSSVFWTERNWLLMGNRPERGNIEADNHEKGTLYQLGSEYPASGYLRFAQVTPQQKKWLMQKRSTAFKEIVSSFKEASFQVEEMQGDTFQANLQIHFNNHDISSFAELIRLLSIVQKESGGAALQ